LLIIGSSGDAPEMAELVDHLTALGLSVSFWNDLSRGPAGFADWRAAATVEILDPTLWSGDLGRFLAAEGHRFRWVWPTGAKPSPGLERILAAWRDGGANRQLVFESPTEADPTGGMAASLGPDPAFLGPLSDASRLREIFLGQ
jgi:hypothetical protein